MVKMKCRKELVYAGRRMKTGTEFFASRSDARILAAIKHADMVVESVAPPIEPSPEGVYETRTVDNESPVEPTQSPDEPRKKRAYKRRDLTAE